MSKIYGFALIFLASTVLPARSTPKQTSSEPLPKGCYIVVAAFFAHQEDYAQRYSSKLNEGGRHAKFGLDPTRRLYFVYLDQYSDFNESVRQMLKVRKEVTFEKAWVRVIKDGFGRMENDVAKKEEPQVQKVSPPPIKKEEPKATEEKKVETNSPEEKKVEELKSVVTEVVENPPAKPVIRPQTLSNTPVFLSLYNATNN